MILVATTLWWRTVWIISIYMCNSDKKSPQFVGLKTPMCLQIFSQQTLMQIHWIFRCICNYHDFTTLISSKCCYLLPRGSKWYQSKSRPKHCYSTSVRHYRPILDRLVTIYNVADRQTDRAMAIGRLSYSIGGLIRKEIRYRVLRQGIAVHFWWLGMLCEQLLAWYWFNSRVM